MSQQNVDVFMRSARAAADGDVAGVIETMDPEIEFIPLRAPVEGSYAGHEDIRRFFADTAETFEVFEPKYADVRDLGDRVLGLGMLRIRGRGSGVETEVPSAIVATFRDGRMTHFKDFGDHAKAIEAAGLSE